MGCVSSKHSAVAARPQADQQPGGVAAIQSDSKSPKAERVVQIVTLGSKESQAKANPRTEAINSASVDGCEEHNNSNAAADPRAVKQPADKRSPSSSKKGEDIQMQDMLDSESEEPVASQISEKPAQPTEISHNTGFVDQPATSDAVTLLTHGHSEGVLDLGLQVKPTPFGDHVTEYDENGLSPATIFRFTQSARLTVETSKLEKCTDEEGYDMINQYRVAEELGSGTSGVVHRCIDSRTGQEFAVKIIRKSLMKRKRIGRFGNAMQNVLREIAVWKKLNHPHVVRLMEVIDDPTEDRLFLVSELVRGGAVQPDALESPPIPEPRARALFHQLVDGLSYLHYQQVVHRDIKPGNMLVTAADHLRLADFGLSQIVENKDSFANTPGTAAFFAPEMLTGASFSAKAVDVWAAGITLYMMLFGRVPFMGKSLPAIYDEIQNTALTFPDSPAVSDAARAFLTLILDKSPETRPTVFEIRRHPWVASYGRVMSPLPDSRIEVSKQETSDAVQRRTTVTAVVNAKRASVSIVGRMRDKVQSKLAIVGIRSWFFNDHTPQGLEEAMRRQALDRRRRTSVEALRASGWTAHAESDRGGGGGGGGAVTAPTSPPVFAETTAAIPEISGEDESHSEATSSSRQHAGAGSRNLTCDQAAIPGGAVQDSGSGATHAPSPTHIPPELEEGTVRRAVGGSHGRVVPMALAPLSRGETAVHSVSGLMSVAVDSTSTNTLQYSPDGPASTTSAGGLFGISPQRAPCHLFLSSMSSASNASVRQQPIDGSSRSPRPIAARQGERDDGGDSSTSGHKQPAGDQPTQASP